MLDRVEALADELRLPLHLPRVLDEDRPICTLLEQRGYHRTAHDPVTRLDITWDSFEGYLASIVAQRQEFRGLSRLTVAQRQECRPRRAAAQSGGGRGDRRDR